METCASSGWPQRTFPVNDPDAIRDVLATHQGNFVKGRAPQRVKIPLGEGLFTSSCRLARELKKKYKLFLLSNVNRLHFEYIEQKFDIIKIFDELILSFVIGAMKPERAIFEDVVKGAGGDKSKILYIDDREDLIKEATAMGIPSIRFESAENFATS